MRLLAGLGIAFAIAGCGSQDSLIDVRGQVTFLATPWPAHVVFQPIDEKGREAGRPSSAYTDDDGRYRLQHTADQYGAKRGLHRVTVTVWKEKAVRDRPNMTFQEATKPIRVLRFTREVASDSRRFSFAIMP